MGLNVKRENGQGARRFCSFLVDYGLLNVVASNLVLTRRSTFAEPGSERSE